MKQSSYRERDYSFGQAMLTLRTRIELTQASLAELLGVSRKAVVRWEAGGTYPNALHLKTLLAFVVKRQAFAAGHEEEEIRAFWQSAHQKVLLDEVWLDELLAQSRSRFMPASSQPTEVTLWTVPYSRNPHFTGRDELLCQLERQLAPKETDKPTTIHHAALTQAQAIKGLGGIGKTQIAVEYAYRARSQGRFTHTLWITAASEDTILASFATLANLLPAFGGKGETDQHKLVAAIIGWLEHCPQPWLLILDNADDLALAQPYLPRHGNGSILFTTRAHAVSSLASSVEVDSMGVMEGAQLLLRRANRFADASDWEINEASNLVVELGQFPLALDQAGAYLEETGCSVSDYLQLYQTHRQALLARRGKQATGYPESVATTWSLSFEQIEQTNPAAAELLRLCAFLAPDHIPEELLIEGALHWPTVLHEAVANPLRFNDLLETLLAFSLVKRLAENHLLSIHRLVQVVQMERIEPEVQPQWAERVVRAVNVVFPRDPENEVTSWPLCQRYLEQAQACDTLIQQHRVLLPEAADILHRTGIYLREHALYTQAEPLFQQALSIREHQLGARHSDTAQSLNDLATLYRRQGKYTQAEPLFQQALSIREHQLGAKHLDTAESLNNLAVLYSNQGKYTQAEPLHQRALSIREQHLGPEHPDIAVSLNNLGFLYYKQGKYTQAEPLYQRALHIDELHLGPEHPEFALSLVNLAILYYEQGKYTQAESLCRRSLHIYELQPEPEHPDMAFPLHWLALVSAKHGQYEESERLDRQALRICEERLGPQHPHMAYPLHGLALLFAKRGRKSQAEALFRQVLCLREQHLRPEHHETANVLHDFAGFQQAQGRNQEAAVLYQRALAIRENVLGADHQLTLDTRAHLQEALVVLGQTHEAASMMGAHKQKKMAEEPKQIPEV